MHYLRFISIKLQKSVLTLVRHLARLVNPLLGGTHRVGLGGTHGVGLGGTHGVGLGGTHGVGLGGRHLNGTGLYNSVYLDC